MTMSLPPKRLVLYADDDADDRALIKDAFDEFSSLIDLILFEDGVSLLSYLNNLSSFEPRPCLIILDVNMPMLDGKETLLRLRESGDFKTVPVVLFTTSTLPSEIAFAKSYGAGFVTKPLHAQQVHAIVDQFVEHCAGDIKEKLKKQRPSEG